MKSLFYLIVLVICAIFFFPSNKGETNNQVFEEVKAVNYDQEIRQITDEKTEHIEELAEKIEKNNTYINYKKRILPKVKPLLNSWCSEGIYIKMIGANDSIIFKGSACKFLKSNSFKAGGDYKFKKYKDPDYKQFVSESMMRI